MEMRNRYNRPGAAAGAMLCLATSLPFPVRAEEPEVTPYRPTVSNPAELSEPGWLEAEIGWQRIKIGGDERDSMPYLLKLPFTPDWGLMLAGDGYINQIAKESGRSDGLGSTALFSKHRFGLGDASALGLEFGVVLPTARRTLGSRKTDYIVNGILSQDIGPYRLDLNVTGTYVGETEAGEDHWQTGWAAAFSAPVTEKWGLAAEFSGAYRRGNAATTQFLASTSYAYNRRIVFDAGIATGLTDAAQDWTVFAGMSMLLANIF